MVETSRRREIEDAASSLFHEHGYSGTSVRDIARAVDIQGASLYAHVASKQEVLWSIVERTASRFEAAADVVEAADPGSLVFGPGVHLISLVRAHVGVVTDDIERASVFVHEWRSLDKGRRDEIARRRDAYEARFRAAIANGIENDVFGAGRPRPDRRLHPDRAQRPRRVVSAGRPSARARDRGRLRGPDPPRRPGPR